MFMKKKILVTEDDPIMRDVYKIILERAGYDVAFSCDAKCIYEDSFAEPDIFILDRHIFETDGLDVCRFLKKGAKTAAIPVIMVSSSPGIILLAKLAGADDSIEKPFIMKDLLVKVNRWINVRNAMLVLYTTLLF